MNNDKYYIHKGDSTKKDVTESEATVPKTSKSTDRMLESNIAAKQQGRSTAGKHAKPGAYSASKQSLSSSPNILDNQEGESSIDQEIAAKQRSRPPSGTPAKPGAYVATSISSSDNDGSDLRGFEADVIAKQRGNSSLTLLKTSAHSVDEEIAAKQRSRPPSGTPAKPGAYVATSITCSDNDGSDLRGFEADVIAKQRGNSSLTLLKTSAHSVDEEIAAKQRSRPPSGTPAKPGAYVATSITCSDNDGSDLRGFEADVIAKQRGNSSFSNNRSTIDQRGEAGQRGAASSIAHVDTLGIHNTDLALANIEFLDRSVNETRPISNDSNAIETMVSEIFELDANIAAKRTALVSLSPSASLSRFNGNVMELKQSILNTIASDENSDKDAVSVSPSKHRKGACDDDHSFINSPSKHEPSQSALHDENLHGLEYGEFGRNDDEGLAVAFAVDEDDEGMYLPSAVEFDPDAKPPMHRNRRFRLYVCLLIAATVVGTVGVVIGIVLTASEDPLPASVPYRATLGIRENLERIVSPEQLDDYNSPYTKAMDWITYTDPMALTPDSPRFLNRFALAYFYYATSQKKPWMIDCAPSESEKANCVFKFILDVDLGTISSDTSFRWLSEKDECKWAGITCDIFNQTMIIRNQGLSGTFPEGLGLLPYLQRIDIKQGELEGPLPAYINRWKNFIDINLQYNMLTGTIPESWFESRSWVTLIANRNLITGSISNNISKLEDIYDLDLSSNRFTGTIPSEIGNMVNLDHLLFHSNTLEGSIPTSIGKLSSTINIRLHSNALTGTIPDEVGDFKELIDLFLNRNLLTGTIPERLYDIPTLRFLHVGNNMLTGTISNKLSKMEEMNELNIENNQFNGTVPFRLAKTEIYQVVAFGNDFNGTVSQPLCQLVKSGQLKKLEFDCSAPLGEVPEIICPEDCCTTCCQSDGENCVELKKPRTK